MKAQSHAFLHFLFLFLTSAHYCNSLETHLLPHRLAGVRDGPLHIKADRKPGNWDGAQVRQYDKAALHSLAFIFLFSSSLSTTLLWNRRESKITYTLTLKIRLCGFPGLNFPKMWGYEDTTQSLRLLFFITVCEHLSLREALHSQLQAWREGETPWYSIADSSCCTKQSEF